MSCSLRDAAALEARGVPTIVYINDVFRPIADATAALLAMPRTHLDITAIYLPHPTSMLTREAVTALVDERAQALFDCAAGRVPANVSAHRDSAAGAFADADPVAAARDALAALASSLRGDGGDLTVDGDTQTLHVRLAVSEGGDCADGSCLLPPEALHAMIASILGSAVPRARVVYEDARSGTGEAGVSATA